MTANEHTGVLGPMHGKEWKKSGGKEYNGDNEPAAEFVMTLDKLEPGQAGVILELNTGGGMLNACSKALPEIRAHTLCAEP